MNLFRKIWLFYYEGFRSMTVGKQLWIIILVKILIIFVLLRVFFFPDFLGSNFKTDRERGDFVREQLIQRK